MAISNDSDYRQKIHLDVRKTDLEELDQIAAEMDLNRTNVIRLAIIEYIQNHRR